MYSLQQYTAIQIKQHLHKYTYTNCYLNKTFVLLLWCLFQLDAMKPFNFA